MSEINLRKLLARKEIASTIREFIEGNSIAITDTLGNLIAGEFRDFHTDRFPVQLSKDELVGWIIGDSRAKTFVPILTYIINQEIEKKSLAKEVLNKYQEINLFYRLSEKIACVLELEVVVDLVIEEAKKLIKTTSGSVMLLNKVTGMLEIASAFGTETYNSPLSPRQGIAGYIFSSGKAEIVNDVSSDCRFLKGKSPVSSIICAPLKTRDKAIGIIIFSNADPIVFTAGDLQLFSALAGQAAKAIENAILYSEREEYALTLEQKVSDRTTELVAIQKELIHSEKLAALGQLVAGVAHEINTPLGAIRASISNISGVAHTTVLQLPQLLQSLSVEEQADFFLLLRTSSQNAIILSSREERQFRKVIAKQLREIVLNESREKIDFLADTFVQMGITGDVAPFGMLLQSRDRDKIMELAINLSSLISNSENIKIAVERASKIVFALKTYAHNDISEQKVPAKISDGLDVILTLYSNLLKKGIEVIRKYSNIPEILCYPDELNQVWTNLIFNAIQSMSGHGTLEIEVGTQQDQIFVKIADSGNGIPLEVQAKVFEPFFTTKPSGEGSGLGLSIVKKIIDKHQGKIAVESIPGRTAFTVTLPSQ